MKSKDIPAMILQLVLFVKNNPESVLVGLSFFSFMFASTLLNAIVGGVYVVGSIGLYMYIYIYASNIYIYKCMYGIYIYIYKCMSACLGIV